MANCGACDTGAHPFGSCNLSAPMQDPARPVIYCNDPAHAEPFACWREAEGGWVCTADSNWADLRYRLERAAEALSALANSEMNANERKRLFAKTEGVMLAIDYMRAYG